jgi:hypothetical protein
MIGYRITRRQIHAALEQAQPGWLLRAKERTRILEKLGRYDEASPIWSEVKSVYMRHQGGNKCSFCEQEPSARGGRRAHRLEHFRPKGAVHAWPVPAELRRENIPFTQPPRVGGYHLLAYNAFNYSTACVSCNEDLKKMYFPIAGRYQLRGRHPERMATERPYLIYPLGDFDDAPEKLIAFNGISPYAVYKRGYRRHRALVTIAFFKLDDEAMQGSLARGRAKTLLLIARAHEEESADARLLRDALTRPTAEHSNCARCFARLFRKNPIVARRIADAALRYVASKS